MTRQTPALPSVGRPGGGQGGDEPCRAMADSAASLAFASNLLDGGAGPATATRISYRNR